MVLQVITDEKELGARLVEKQFIPVSARGNSKII